MILVSKQSANIGDANVWYQAEAYNFTDYSATLLILSTKRFIPVTHANAGNSLGLLLSMTVFANISIRGYAYYGRVYANLQTALGTCTTPVASPGIVTKAGHGFTGAKTVTITTGTPGVINMVGHGLYNDMPVGFTTTGAFTGITAGTVYYVKRIDADTFSLLAKPSEGTEIAISAASGTISMWDEWVEFSTAGTLPTGISATYATSYCVKYIDANTFNISTTAGGTNSNFTGTSTGTHTLWRVVRAKGLSAAAMAASSSFVIGSYVRGFDINGYAVTNAANTYRWSVMGFDYTTAWSLKTSDGTNPFYVTWCDTTQTYSDTNDAIVIRKDIGHVITINQSLQPKPYLGTGTLTFAYHGIICSSDDETIATSSGLVWENSPASPYTYTMDGTMKIAAGASVRCGTTASPIPYAQKARFVCKRVPTVGSTAGISGFGDGSVSQVGANYAYHRASVYMYGEIPTVKQCRLVSDAAVGQKDLIVDNASGFSAGDQIFVGKSSLPGSAGYILASAQSDNTIASISGNTITLTLNLLGYKRLGRTTVGAATISEANPTIVTLTAHGLFENEEVCFGTTGSLPTGLTATTGYYFVHKIDANTFNLKALRSDSTYIATSSAGSGTHTCYRAGGHVTKGNGYGIEIESDSLTLNCNWAFMAPANVQFSGVKMQNTRFLGYSAGVFSVPYFDLSVMEPWRVEDCLFLGYNRATTTGFSNMSANPTLGYYFNRNLDLFNSSVIGPNFISNAFTLDSGTKSIFTGPFYARDNYVLGSTNYIAFNSNAIGGNIERNVFDSCMYAATVYGNSKSFIRYNYAWGGSSGTYVISGADIPKTNITGNVSDNMTNCVSIASPTVVNSGELNNVYNPTTHLGTDLNIVNGGYYLGEAGYTIESPSRVLSVVSSLFYGYIVDWISISKLKISNNSGTTNYNVVYTPEGTWRTTGDGLADTTAHTIDTGKYAWRCDPLNTAYNRAEKKSKIPTGNLQGLTGSVGIWCNINSANFYAGTYEMPRLTVNYDNGTTAYAEAAEVTGWQFISVPFTPTTTYPEITVTLSGQTDATFADTTTAGNSSVYWDDFAYFQPPGMPPLNLGAFDLWANAEPIEAWVATPVSSPQDTWSVNPTTFGANTVGDLVNRVDANASLIPGID